MTTKGSIARRLAITLGLCTLGFWLCAVAVAGLVLRAELNSVFDQNMEQSASRLLPLAAHELSEIILEGEYEDEEARVIAGLTEQGSNLDYFITDRAGRVLVFSSQFRPRRSAITIAPGFSEFDGSRAFALRDGATGFGIVVVEKEGLRTELLRESLMAMVWPLAALLPVLIGLVFLVVRIAMSPVWKLGLAISKRSGRNLTPLDPEPQPIELVPIVTEVENLLGRLDAALEAERNFAAESAHELRTPIAGALAQVQVLRSRLEGTPDLPFVEKAETALRSLAELSENLLQSARLEAGFAMSADATQLEPIIDLVLAEPEFIAHIEAIIVEGRNSGLRAFIMPDAFAIVFRNLVRNALLHRDGAAPVTIDITPSTISIRNDCNPLQDTLMDALTKRFVRGDESKRGSGLGLSIAAGIVKDCGGTLHFASPAPGDSRGFVVTVDFG